MQIDRFPHYTQLDSMDCGPTCLRMIAKYYGRRYSLETLRDKAFITREGVSMLGISDAAESIGVRTSGVRITLRQLKEDVAVSYVVKHMFFIAFYSKASYVCNRTKNTDDKQQLHEEIWLQKL